MRQINKIILHHSASSIDTTTDQIRLWHTTSEEEGGRGWSDIGYHFVIERGGEIIKGRPIHRMGAHCKGKNVGSIGICIVGNNMELDDQWEPLQIQSLVRLLEILFVMFDLGPEDIYDHRHFANTLCPGIDAADLIRTYHFNGLRD